MPIKYTILNKVTDNVWKWETGVEKIFKVVSAIRVGKAPRPGSTITKAAELLDVIDVADGEKKTLIVGQVVKDNLIESYPNDGYVGRTFRAVQGSVPVGKKYKTYEIAEVEVEGAEDAPEAPAPAPAKGKRK